MGDSQHRGPLRRRDRAFNLGAWPVPTLGITIELLEGAAGANLLDPEAA